MSFREFLKNLFNESDRSRQEREEDEVVKSLSLAACERTHKLLLECYKNSWIGGCQTEMDKFWKCVNDQKAILQEKAKSYRMNERQPNKEQETYKEPHNL